MRNARINELLGQTFSSVCNLLDTELRFVAADGSGYKFTHDQDCCEQVYIEDICGDLNDLVGSQIVLAEEVSSDGYPAPKSADSYTWTFYRFGTVKGAVTVRWLGESNGYYSEQVDMYRFEAGER